MATPSSEALNAAQDQAQAQIDALQAQKGALVQNFRRPNLLPREFQQEANDRHHRELAAIQNQIDAIRSQYRVMDTQYRRGAQEQNQAAKVAEAQQKRQEALVKAADAQRKVALTQTQEQLADILGTKPKELRSTLRDSYYDPKTHKLVVPKDTPAAKDAIQDAKHNGAVVNKDLQEYAPENLASGKKQTLVPATFFDKDPRVRLPYTTVDGNRIYTKNGKPFVTIPEEEATRLQNAYNNSVARPSDVSAAVDPDDLNAARQQIGRLGGGALPDIVGETQARESRYRLEQPAFRAAFPDSYSGEPGMFGFGERPSVTERIAPALAIPFSGASNSVKPLVLPSAPVTLQPPMLNEASQNNVFYTDSAGNQKLAPNQPSLLNPNITARLPEKTVTLPQLGVLPEITQTLPAEVGTPAFQNNPLGTDIAMPGLPFADRRLEAFRPGYQHQPTSQDIVDKRIDDAAARWQVPREKAAAVFKKVGDLNPKDTNEFNSLVEAGIGALPEVKDRGIMDSIRMNPTSAGIFRAINSVNPASTQENSLEKGLARLSAPLVDSLTPDMYNNPDLLGAALRLQKAKGLVPDNTTLKQYVADRINSDQEMADAAAQEPMY